MISLRERNLIFSELLNSTLSKKRRLSHKLKKNQITLKNYNSDFKSADELCNYMMDILERVTFKCVCSIDSYECKSCELKDSNNVS